MNNNPVLHALASDDKQCIRLTIELVKAVDPGFVVTFGKAIYERKKNWNMKDLGKTMEVVCKNSDACSQPGVYTFVFDESNSAGPDSSNKITISFHPEVKTYTIELGLYIGSTIVTTLKRWIDHEEGLWNDPDELLLYQAAQHFKPPRAAAAFLA